MFLADVHLRPRSSCNVFWYSLSSKHWTHALLSIRSLGRGTLASRPPALTTYKDVPPTDPSEPARRNAWVFDAAGRIALRNRVRGKCACHEKSIHRGRVGRSQPRSQPGPQVDGPALILLPCLRLASGLSDARWPETCAVCR